MCKTVNSLATNICYTPITIKNKIMYKWLPWSMCWIQWSTPLSVNHTVTIRVWKIPYLLWLFIEHYLKHGHVYIWIFIHFDVLNSILLVNCLVFRWKTCLLTENPKKITSSLCPLILVILHNNFTRNLQINLFKDIVSNKFLVSQSWFKTNMSRFFCHPPCREVMEGENWRVWQPMWKRNFVSFWNLTLHFETYLKVRNCFGYWCVFVPLLLLFPLIYCRWCMNIDWVAHFYGLFGAPDRVCIALVEDPVLTSKCLNL